MRQTPNLANEPLELLIFTIRNRRVILDADLAQLYGVTTKAFNQAVKRNADRFPQDFAFRLTVAEAGNLKSQFVTSSLQVADIQEDLTNRSQIVTGSQKHRDQRFSPWAFTEHGALMAANVLRSKRAVQMSVFVVRAFVRLREQVAANQVILERLADIDRTLLDQDVAVQDIYRKLLPLLQPQPEPPKRRIGFHTP